MEKSELEHHCFLVVDCVTHHLTEFEVRLLWKANLDLLEACVQQYVEWSSESEVGSKPQVQETTRVVDCCTLAISQLRKFFLKREEPSEEERLQAEIMAAYLSEHLPDAVGTS